MILSRYMIMKMDKKQLYETIMASIAKEVKKALNESKHEFSKNDLKEIREIMLEDQDFYKAYCEYGNIDRYDSFEESVDDLMDFLEYNLYSGDKEEDKNVHSWYILDEPDSGTSWCKLKSEKLLNLDNLWLEYKGYVQD